MPRRIHQSEEYQLTRNNGRDVRAFGRNFLSGVLWIMASRRAMAVPVCVLEVVGSCDMICYCSFWLNENGKHNQVL